MIIAIDPGVNGGMAYYDPAGAVVASKWTVLGDVHDRLETACALADSPVAYLEHVTSSPIMGKKACFTFGHNFGQWEALLYSLRIKTILIKPQVWQKDIPNLSGKQGAARKKHSKHKRVGFSLT